MTTPILAQKQAGIVSRESDVLSPPADRSSCLSKKQAAQACIVIQESHPRIQEFLVWALTLAGYTVMTPDSPQSRPPDLLLLDIGPGSPEEVEEMLRLQHALLPEHPGPPIIVSTTNPDLQLTGYSVLLKPFHLSTLYDLVALQLELAQHPAGRGMINAPITRSLKRVERGEEGFSI